MKKLMLSWLCLISLILVNNTKAVVYYWDPENTATPTAANLSAIWNPSSGQWVNGSATQSASPVGWSSGVAADFSAGSTAPSSGYIVTVNSAIPIGGIFNGSLSSPSSLVSINGTGSLSLASNSVASFADAFDVGTSSSTAINVPITGPGQAVLETPSGTTAGAKVYFDEANSYKGGTYLGYPGVASFSGLLVFSNAYAFGTGPIMMTPLATGCALQQGGTAAMTITNAVWATNTLMYVTGNTAGLTFSGPWSLASTPTLGTGPSGGLITISGVMSGGGGFTKFGPAMVVLSGSNTYSGITTVSNGTLCITADNNLGTNPPVAGYDIYLSGGVLSASNTFTLSANRLIALTANTSLSVSSGQTMSYGGVISGAYALTKAGNGTLALSGANGYTKTTTIATGTLEADCQSGSSTGPSSVSILSVGTLSGIGLVGGAVSGAGKLAPGTAAGPGTLTLDNGLDLSSGGTFVWNLSTNDTSSGFSTLTLNGGNLNLGGSSKLSINLTGTASAPDTNNPFWQVPEVWTIVSENGLAGNSSGLGFASIPNGNYAAGNFINYASAGGLTLQYNPNFAYFIPLIDDGADILSSGEDLIFTNFSGLPFYVWSSTNATLPVSSWNLEGPMIEEPLSSPAGYSRYFMNVNPVVSPTYYVAGNRNTGPYLAAVPVTASIVTSPDDFNTINVLNTNVAINAAGVLELVPYPPVITPVGMNVSGQYQFQFSAETNVNYIIEASTDLINWTPVDNGVISNSPMTFIDTTAASYRSRFYRVVLP